MAITRAGYRSFQLAWELDIEQERLFRRLWTWMLGIAVLLGLLVWLVELPPRASVVQPSIPPRLAKIMIERELPPPPPPPPPKVEEPPPRTDRPQPAPRPQDRVAEARRRAEQSMASVRDELADLRRSFAEEPVAQARNLSGAVGAEARSERALITSRAGAGSAGVRSTGTSQGFGSGAGSLTGHSAGAVTSRVGAIAGTANAASRSGSSGKAARSQEEIELEFDRNKGAIYALYSRALRERPELQGKMVLEFTIAPSGEVTACRVVSSELGDAELERRIVARVKAIRFPARDVESITTTKPIEFFPG